MLAACSEAEVSFESAKLSSEQQLDIDLPLDPDKLPEIDTPIDEEEEEVIDDVIPPFMAECNDHINGISSPASFEKPKQDSSGLSDVHLGQFSGDMSYGDIGHLQFGNVKGNIEVQSSLSVHIGQFEGTLKVHSTEMLHHFGNVRSKIFVNTVDAHTMGHLRGAFCLGIKNQVQNIGNFDGVLMLKGTADEQLVIENMGQFRGVLILDNVKVKHIGNIRAKVFIKNSIIERMGQGDVITEEFE